MEPIRINLATFEYLKKMHLMILGGAAVMLIVITWLNFSIFITHKNNLREYAAKVKNIEKTMADEAALSQNLAEEIEGEDAEAMMARTVFANRLIAQDIFPYNRLLEMLETKVPEGLAIQSFMPSEGYESLALKGKAVSERKVTFFLKRLEEWNMVDDITLTEFSTAPADTDVSFSINCRLVAGHIFDGPETEGIVNALVHGDGP